MNQVKELECVAGQGKELSEQNKELTSLLHTAMDRIESLENQLAELSKTKKTF